MFSLKSFSVISVLSLLVAFVGILSQGGRATWITWLSITPLGAWVLFMLGTGVLGWFSRRR